MPQNSSCDDCRLTYAAGLIEGEGSFCTYPTIASGRKYQCFRISASMTDREPLDKLADIMGGHVGGPCAPQTKGLIVSKKPRYWWQISGRDDVVDWCKKLRPHMSPRRQAQIDTVLAAHANYPPKRAAQHGSHYKYCVLGCRCPRCTKANTDANRKWKHASKSKL